MRDRGAGAASDTTGGTGGTETPIARTRRQLIGLTCLLGTLMAVAPLTLDMYLPAMPDVVTDLDTTPAAVQLTLAGAMVGVAIGQLIVGPLSDALGRRGPLFVGMAVHVGASIAISVSDHVATLTVLRVIQGLGAAAAATVAIAVVRDVFVGVEVSVLLSRLMLVLGVTPLLAPLGGALLVDNVGWRGIFVALGVLGVLVALVAARYLEETRPRADRVPFDRNLLRSSYRPLLRDPTFLGLGLVTATSLAGVYAYIGGGPFFLQDGYGLSPLQFALIFTLQSACTIAGTQISAVLVRRWSIQAVFLLGLSGIAFWGVLALLMTATGWFGIAGFIVPTSAALGFVGLVLPNGPALALANHREVAGTATAVLGFMQNALGAAMVPIAGLLGTSSPVPTMSVMAACYVVGLGAYLVLSRSRAGAERFRAATAEASR